MKNKSHGLQRGFTLIEVVLVLAIGGLIFLLAFLAFRQASKNRVDAQRRDNARQALALAESFAGDGSFVRYPCYDSSAWACSSPTWSNFVNSYYNNSDIVDPSNGALPALYGYNGVTYSMDFSYWHGFQSGLPEGTLVYVPHAQCESGSLFTRPIYTATDIGVVVKLGEGKTTCVDS